MSYAAAQSNASSVRPLLEGDEIHGRLIRGFAWKAPVPGQRSGHQDDKLLLDGDERLPVPPDRSVPQSSDDAVATAPVPPADLPPDQVRQAADVDPALAGRVDALLDLSTAEWEPVIRPLLAAVHATGHRLWLTGGAVRDAASNVPLAEINDLDMTGTAPPGRFVDITYQALRAVGKTEHRLSVSPGSLVCAVAVARNKRIIEYRGLSIGGFPYPAVGSRLAEDARHRDFSFNALVYDALDHAVFDPTGTGLRDLIGGVRRFRPIKETDRPLELALVVLRAMKFALRWSGTADRDLGPFYRWVETLPAELWRSLSGDDWSRLRRERRKLDFPDDQQREFAAALPQAGRKLLWSLIGGS
jgi:hypothetical protein